MWVLVDGSLVDVLGLGFRLSDSLSCAFYPSSTAHGDLGAF